MKRLDVRAAPSKMRAALLIRPRAWWFNKVPLSVTLVLLLLDGSRLSWSALVVLITVILTVCAVGNYGYAINELFDIDEDAVAGRSNAAATFGIGHTGWVAFGSAALAGALAVACAGAVGAAVTALELVLPLAYSVRPLRLKERKWLGVGADALAAHV